MESIRAVLDLHRPIQPEHMRPWVHCAECGGGRSWPCPTVKAIGDGVTPKRRAELNAAYREHGAKLAGRG